MSFLDSLIVSLFGLTIVFVVLIALSGIVVLQSKLVGRFGKKHSRGSGIPEDSIPEEDLMMISGPDSKHDQLILVDVDEKTAAMVMAIVSHESQIPLNELQFKQIRAID